MILLQFNVRPVLVALAMSAASGGAVHTQSVQQPEITGQAQTPQAEGQSGAMTLEQAMSVEIPSVEGASRFVQEVTDAPANVTIVTKEDIDRFGYTTFDEILRSVRGFYVSYDRNYAYVGVRGYSRPGDYNSRVLLLVNGHRLNDNVYDAAPIGTDFPIDVSLIERVEVVRGPSSSLYGTSAFFAVVNVVTKTGANADSGAGLTVGTLGTRSGRLTFGKAFKNGADVLLSASAFGSDGLNRVTIGDTGLQSVGLDDDGSWSLFGNASRGRWRLEGAYVDRTKGIATGAFETSIDDGRSKTDDRTGYGELRFQGPIHGTSVLWRATYDRYFYDGTYGSGEQNPLFRDYSRGQWVGTEGAATRRFAKHLVTAGVELRYNAQQAQGAFDDTDPRTVYLDDKRHSFAGAIYAQDELKLSPKWIVNAGIRYDHLAPFGGSTNPRVALIYKPVSTGSLKVLHGTAFRAPNVYEIYSYTDASAWLQPERIRTTELVWEQYFRSSTRILTSIFQNRIADLISQGMDPAGLHGIAFYNIKGAEAKGFEAEVDRSWSHGVQTLGNYTFTSAHDREVDAPLSNSPRHLAEARVTVPTGLDRATLGLELRYSSGRLALDGSEAAGYWIANLTFLDRQLAKALQLSVTLDNLFDHRYSDPVAEEHITPTIVQDGRTAHARIAWRF